jgi:hypothetical protein
MRNGMHANARRITTIDPDATFGEDFLFGVAAQGERQLLSREELCSRLTAVIRSGDGCENVSVLEVYRLEKTDSRDGCNWSLALMLDPAGVEPEVYVLAYGAVLAMARERWNLEDSNPPPEPSERAQE